MYYTEKHDIISLHTFNGGTDYKKTETALRKVAEENGVSLEEVRRDIQAIIDDLYNSDDPEIKSKWRSITETGQKPTVEQMIEYLTAKVTRQMNNKHYS